MFNATRTLFPAYSNLEDVKVSLPSPPSRAAVARDVGDLWKQHTSEPHITPLEDPGVAVPLPDNGFDPRRDLSETSPENILANRGSGSLNAETFETLSETLRTLYAKCLESNQHLLHDSVGEIKSHMDQMHPGALFVYNGTNKDLLIKALSLIESLGELSDTFVAGATFAEEAKSDLITFLKISPAVREAMFLPDPMLRQRLFGNTTTFNHVADALNAFGLNEVGGTKGAYVRSDDEFSDHREALALASAELRLAANLDMCDGLAGRALNHCVQQVLPVIGSSELRAQLRDCIVSVQQIAAKSALKCAAEVGRIVQQVKSDMQHIGVDPATFRKLQLKERKISESEKRARAVTGISTSTTSHMSPRTFNELAKASKELAGIQQQLEGFVAKASTLSAEHKLALYCELYCVMCMQDCCGALASGVTDLTQCARRLYDAVCDEVCTSEVSELKILANDVEIAEKSLQSAQVSQTIHLLQKAKSENSISDKKLETLTKLIG